MNQDLHKQLVMSNRQNHDTLKHKFERKMEIFNPKYVAPKSATYSKRIIELLNPFTKLQDFLNNTRNLNGLVTIHGRKKWL